MLPPGFETGVLETIALGQKHRYALSSVAFQVERKRQDAENAQQNSTSEIRK